MLCQQDNRCRHADLFCWRPNSYCIEPDPVLTGHILLTRSTFMSTRQCCPCTGSILLSTGHCLCRHACDMFPRHNLACQHTLLYSIQKKDWPHHGQVLHSPLRRIEAALIRGSRVRAAPTFPPQHLQIVLAIIRQKFHRLAACGLHISRCSHIHTKTSSPAVPHQFCRDVLAVAVHGTASVINPRPHNQVLPPSRKMHAISTWSCDLLMCGCGAQGQLGLGDEGDRMTPTLAAAPHKEGAVLADGGRVPVPCSGSHGIKRSVL